MTELRADPFTGRRVFLGTAAPRAVKDYALDEPHVKASGDCPFCPGKEGETPPEAAVWGRPPGGRPAEWRVRAVPNSFPAVAAGAFETGHEDVYDRMSAYGVHEVVIEHPDHGREMRDFTVEEMRLVLTAYRERLRAIARDRRLRSVLIFKNYGAKAGASLEHPHTQIIALPVVPHEVEDEVRTSEAHFRKTGLCLHCEALRDPAAKPREVLRLGGFLAFAPPAPRFPFETLIFPLGHGSRFEDLSAEELDAFGAVLTRVLRRLAEALRDPPFNFFFHFPPLDAPRTPGFHWHLEIIPKIIPVTAFEWGTGCYVHSTPPELAASILRG